MALIYLSSSVSFFFGLKRKSFLVSVLPCLSPFLSQLLFHEIRLLVFGFFSISFPAKPKRSLLPCQPSLREQHSVPKISPYQETTNIPLKLQLNLQFHFKIVGISIAISQNYKNTCPGITVCLCSPSLSVYLFTPLRVFVFEHLLWTDNMSSTDFPYSPPMTSFPQR